MEFSETIKKRLYLVLKIQNRQEWIVSSSEIKNILTKLFAYQCFQNSKNIWTVKNKIVDLMLVIH
jgi:hypothetical protein